MEWLSGVVMLVWLLGLHTPELTGFGQVIAALIGVAMLVLGLGSVRLSGAVRRRERGALAGAAAAERAEKRAAKKVDERVERPAAKAFAKDPVAPANPRWDSEMVEPVVGEAIARPAAPAPSATAFDPATGHVIDPATGRSLDPATGRAFDPVSGHKIDPETSPDRSGHGRTVDPVTGQFIDPVRRDPR